MSLQMELQKTTTRGTHVTSSGTTEDNNMRNSCHFKWNYRRQQHEELMSLQVELQKTTT